MSSMPTASSTAHKQFPPPTLPEWSPPKLEGSFHSAFGSSLIEEFVVGHDAADVLRELVQNEFDGGGDKLTISFGTDHLSVTGNGKAIDANGWSRLSLLLGTGRVVGGGHGSRVVQPKLNGIGSKNFGLRSLFIFGDRIHVRSDGQLMVLDLPALGTQKLDDPSSRGLKGVRIHVPYRGRSFHSLEQFSVDREREAFAKMADATLPTLVKLALHGRRKGIRELHISSERIGRRLVWRQTASSLRCKVKGVSAVRRTGILIDSLPESSRPRTRKFEEIEFSRAVPIPDEYSSVPFPAYFRSRGGLRVCVSLSTKGKRANGAATGRFYYPLAVEHSLTGTAVSVNAPFQLDSDRSKVLDTNWNRWLTKQSAELACDLLVDDWFRRFGAAAYIAIRTNTADPTWFADQMNVYLSTARCWPTRLRAAGRSVPVEATQVVVPDQPELGGFLSDRQYFDDRLASNPSVIELIFRFGAKPFTANSLVRLRCASRDGILSTKVPTGEANYYFGNYDLALRDEDRQVQMAGALTRLFPRLSNQNRRDLKETISTLAADGSLQAARNLYRVPESIWDVCPVPLSRRLHPKLRDYKGISRHSLMFEIDEWASEVAERAAQGSIDEHEREALYRYLLENGSTIGSRALSIVRRSPVLKDHRDDWVAPEVLLLLPRAQFELMDPVISVPSQDVIKASDLINRLRIRRKLTGDDLLRLARYVAKTSERADVFEQFLTKNLPLLNARMVGQLKSIPFLRAPSGILGEPQHLHIRTQANLACIEPEDSFVGGTNISLYRRLGCPDKPSSTALLNSLHGRRSQGAGPSRPEKFYPALVDALRHERKQATAYEDEAILWVAGSYRSPRETLVGARVPRCFELAVPVFRGTPAVGHAYLQLGASPHPTERHWETLFLYFSKRPLNEEKILPHAERRALREAYQRRGHRGLPEKLADTTRCLLSRDGTLHSLAELNARTFVQDDYPELGSVLEIKRVNLAFADWIDSTADFFAALRIARLTELCQAARISVGAACSAPHWFREVHESKVLGLIKRPDFAAALRALALASQRRDGKFQPVRTRELEARLTRIERVSFASAILRTYSLANVEASIRAEGAISENRIVLLPTKSWPEFQQILAYILAELVGASHVLDLRNVAVLIFPLLQSRSTRDMAAYLRRQGISEPTWSREGEDTSSFQDDATESDDTVAELIVRGIVTSLNSAQAVDDVEQSDAENHSGATIVESAPESVSPLSLFPIDQVKLRMLKQFPNWIAPNSTTANSGRGQRWAPPSATDVERDREVGLRGEELVYWQELDRVRALGYTKPEDHVVWTSLTDPGADHDIKSIAENGQPLWIEVKSTLGTDGRFEWPRKEFEKALTEGDRYELWRIYQAHTDQPSAKCFRNPIALLRLSALKLELGVLRAVVEPMSSPPSAED
jgi:hypothetical protein